MKENNYALPVIATQQMIVFLHVVEKQGFARAAAGLHMTQSAVSKSIARLEQELGFLLFVRTTRRLELTQSGRILYDSWKKVLDEMQGSYDQAVRAEKQNNERIRLGVLNTARPDRYLHQMLSEFQQKDPEIHFEVESRYMTDLIRDLTRGDFDLVIVPDFVRYHAEKLGLSWRYVAKENACLLVSSTHPLARRRKLKAADLLNLTFVSVNGFDGDEDYRRDLTDRLKPYGGQPKIAYTFKTAYDLRYLFNPDRAVLLVDAFFDDGQSAGKCKKIPIVDQENGLIGVWDPKKCRQRLKKILESIDGKEKQLWACI